MDFIRELQKNSGIVNESKYGNKFDLFKLPFRNEGKNIKDADGKDIAECKNVETAKELTAILNDIRKMREICERMISMSR